MSIKHCQENLRSRCWFATHVRHLRWVPSFFLALKTTILELWYTRVNSCASRVQSIMFNSGPTDSPSSLIFPLPVLQMPAKFLPTESLNLHMIMAYIHTKSYQGYSGCQCKRSCIPQIKGRLFKKRSYASNHF